jgi:hypothetical protein
MEVARIAVLGAGLVVSTQIVEGRMGVRRTHTRMMQGVRCLARSGNADHPNPNERPPNAEEDTMKRILIVTLAILLPLFGTSCTDESLTTAVNDDASVQSAEEPTLATDQRVPQVLLWKAQRCQGQGSGCEDQLSKKATGGMFASPLFGLATAPNGDILVADAGAGIALVEGATDISLPGVTGIGPIGRGALWATTGAGADPESDTGQGIYRVAQGRNRMIANLFAFEAANDPDGPLNPPDGNVDSNPFDVEALGGQAALVVDAGGNDLLRVDNEGNVEVLAVFPNELVSTDNIKNLIGCPNPADLCSLPPMIPAQAVPTSVAVGPDGYYYVGELKGFPAPAGASNIWRVAPAASGAVCGVSPDCQKVFDGGFTSIIDLAFGADGTLYVAELDEQSWFAVEVLGGGAGGTINACDVGALSCTEVATGIPILTAITLGKDGTLWATRNALIPRLADVVEIP